MTRASFNRLLVHTCTIERNTPTTSPSGEPIASWSEVDTEVACRYAQKRQTFPSEALTAEQVRNDLLLLSHDADIQEGDRVTDIAWRVDATSVDAGPFEVTSVLDRTSTRAHHISAALERVG